MYGLIFLSRNHKKLYKSVAFKTLLSIFSIVLKKKAYYKSGLLREGSGSFVNQKRMILEQLKIDIEFVKEQNSRGYITLGKRDYSSIIFLS